MVACVAVLGVAALALVGLGSASGPTSSARIPTLYVMYAMNCTFSFVNDSGQAVTSIPPGSYEVDVRTPLAFGTVPLTGVTDLTACHGQPQFQLSGPGVSLFTTMNAGCSVDLLFPETFQPNATYVGQDNNQPSATRATLTVQGSGAPATLAASIGGNGSSVLTLNGKPVTTLRSGRYTFAITDRDAKTGFTLLGPNWKAPSTLTRPGFTGRVSKTVRLTSGRWTYYAGLRSVHYFIVTG